MLIRSVPLARATRGIALALLATVAVSCAISQQQEVDMGAQYATQIDTQLPLIRDAQIVNYINTLGNALAAVTDTRGLTGHFSGVDSKEGNACAVPGGWVYVNRGLIARVTSMDQLAGVLGHEIGHVTLRHTVQQMQQSQGMNGGLMALCTLTKVCESGVGQTAINLGGTALFASFSRQDEAQADDEGVKTVVKARIEPRGIPEMFRILMNERKSNPGAVDAWFATHPLEEDSITATTKQIAAYPAASIKGLTIDTQAFQNFKRRLASLPPSPTPRAAR